MENVGSPLGDRARQHRGIIISAVVSFIYISDLLSRCQLRFTFSVRYSSFPAGNVQQLRGLSRTHEAVRSV